VLHAAEGLWLQCLDEARRRAQAESTSSRKTLARERQDLEVQSHILSIRESELKNRIDAAESRAARLELELETLTTLLRKEQASRLAAERRAATAPAPAAAPRRNAPKPVRKPPRTGVARKRTVKTRRKPR
jgi:peptidoglycan hydrolase CwlO-like protein